MLSPVTRPYLAPSQAQSFLMHSAHLEGDAVAIVVFRYWEAHDRSPLAEAVDSFLSKGSLE